MYYALIFTYWRQSHLYDIPPNSIKLQATPGKGNKSNKPESQRGKTVQYAIRLQYWDSINLLTLNNNKYYQSIKYIFNNNSKHNSYLCHILTHFLNKF